MKLLRCLRDIAIGMVLLGLLTLLAACDKIPPPLEAGEPSISVSLQETTVTVTATWTRPPNAPPEWAIHYEWTNVRTSGGDACDRSGQTTETSVTFQCPRAETTTGVMLFEVWGVRSVAGNLYPGQKTGASYDVPPTGVIPPDPVDSLRIEIAVNYGTGEFLTFENAYIEFDPFIDALGVQDTTWKYFVIDPATGDSILWTEGTSTLGHGMDLAALAYDDNGALLWCNGDCRGVPPELILTGYDWGQAPISFAMAN